jgi:hypothetical protein
VKAGALALGFLAAQAAVAGDGLRGVWTAERSTWRLEKAGTTTLV